MSFFAYLLKASLALAICWALYGTAFRRLTFFQWNRFYLLASVVLSLILPLFSLKMAKAMEAAAGTGGIDWTYLDHVTALPAALAQPVPAWSPASFIWVGYLAVALALLARSMLRFRQLGRIIRSARQVRKGRIRVYVQDQRRGSFTVFRSIYLDSYAFEQRLRPVLRHEMVHAVQLHSLDLFFMEFVAAMLWFNPFVYLLLRDIRESHEYLADRSARSDRDSLREYLECLKAEAIRSFSPVPANYFKSSTIKKRIIMLTNHKSDRGKLWRYLAILPVMSLILLLCQSPAEPVLAASSTDPGSVFNPMVPHTSADGIPSRFPLPEAYKDRISWGFDEIGIHPISRKKTTHLGIDIAAPTGTPVYAAAQGVVLKASHEEGWGMLVVLEHEEGYSTFYAHMSSILVEPGMKVGQGELIGRVGNTGQSTGSHLHYEVRVNGKHRNPAVFF